MEGDTAHDPLNRLELDYAENEDLAAVLAGKEPGETCRLTIDLTTVANQDGKFTGSVDEIEVEGYEKAGAEDTAKPDDESPVLAVFMPNKRKKRGKETEEYEETPA